HEVTVFAGAGSEVDGALVETAAGPYQAAGAFDDWQLAEWTNLCAAVARSDSFDVIHCHAYLWGVPLEPLSRAPMLHTLHIVADSDHARLRAARPGAWVTATSAHQWSAFPEHSPTAIVPHGVRLEDFP